VSVVTTQDARLTTDEELRRAMVGALRPHEDSIALVDYDAAWEECFAREAERIGDALLVEHVGSTSLSGLPAGTAGEGRSSTSSWQSPTRPTSLPTCPGWRPADTSCAPASSPGTSTAC
jgi:GrpB protein